MQGVVNLAIAARYQVSVAESQVFALFACKLVA